MTAAALRPELFNHLFASRRGHPEKGDLAASMISLVLHGGAAAVMVWASTTLKPDADRTVETVAVPIVFAAPEPRISNGGGGGGGGDASRPIVLPPDLDQPVPDPGPTPFDKNPWVEPGTPGLGPRDSLRSGPPGDGGETRGGFVVSSEVPRLLNALEVQRSLERNYPPFLRDAGIGGEVTLWLLIDENGRVVDTDIRERSGHPALDEAAVKVGEIIRFSPGMNRAARVKVWVSLPIRFKTQ